MPKTTALILVVLITVGFLTAGYLSRRPETHEGKTVVTYMTWGAPEQRLLEQLMADQFMAENPDIEVRIAHVPSSAYAMKQNIMLASGTAPDVMRVDHYLFPAMVRKGYFKPLEPIVREWKADFDLPAYLDQFVPAAVQEGYHDKKLYGMNMLFGARVLYYNTTLFNRMGLPTPYELWKEGKWDMEHFRETCAKLANNDPDPKQRIYGVRLNTESFWPLLWSMGGDGLNLETGEVKLDSPETIAAFEFQMKLIKDGLSPGRELEKDPSFQFESGRIGMLFGWAGEAVRFKDSGFLEWDIAPIPEGKGGRWTTAKGNQLVISANCTHPVAAWRWMQYLVSEKCEREMYVVARRSIPTRKTLLEKEYSVPNADPKVPPRHPEVYFACLNQYGRTLPINARWFEWTTEMETRLDGMWLGTKTPKEAAGDAQKAVKDILSRDDY